MKNLIRTFVFLLSWASFSQNNYALDPSLPNPIAFTQVGIDALGSTMCTIHINKNVTITSDLKIPTNVSLKFYSGSVITINNASLQINGPMDAGAFQIFECIGSGETIGRPLVDRVLPHWWRTKADVVFWSRPIQRAVDFYPKVYFPPLSRLKVHDSINNDTIALGYYINKTIYLDLSKRIPSGYYLYGAGRGSYFETRPDPQFNGFVFSCIKTPVEGFNEGLVFKNLSFFCKQGIAVNGGGPDPAHSFDDEKYSIKNLIIDNCKFMQNSTKQDDNLDLIVDDVAIVLRKVFDADIFDNYIEGFGYGINLEGSDLNTIRNNRITKFYRYCIFDRAFTTHTTSMGSQNQIIHNDLLHYLGKQEHNSFIKTYSNHVEIRDNYLENQNYDLKGSKLKAYIDCSLDRISTIDTTNIVPHYSYHLDITGNRCDVTTNSTNFIYYLDENFKSLNLVEIPNFNPAATQRSTFAKIEIVGTTFVGTPVNRIPLKIKDSNYDKVINMTNCDSFTNWENFSSSKTFTHTSDGDFVIDPKTISYVGEDAAPIWSSDFNPRSFRLQASYIKDKVTYYPAIFINFSQRADISDLGDLFSQINIKLKVRNLGSDPSVTDDLFLRIDDLTAGLTGIFVMGSIDIPHESMPVANYYMINIPITPLLLGATRFDSTHDYRLVISSKSTTVKEFKEIIIENAFQP